MPGNLRREFTNLPNLVTMGRVVLIPFVLFFIDNFSPLRSFIASLLYLGAAAGDALDGYLARSRGQVSMLGKFLDPLADKLIVTAALVYMVSLARVPAWVVVVLIARDLAINGLRSVASAQGLVIAASDGGKIKTALQLVAIMMLLIYFRYPVLGTSIMLDYHRAGLIVLYISMGVSLFSGAQYLRDFFAAALRPSSPSQSPAQAP
jgi:CDP-diacylglycerol--glycerol-3-phosphate 3-phosphatidyltransferase